MNLINLRRRIEEKIFVAVTALAGLATAMLLLVIIGDIFLMGYESLDWSFITSAENDVPGFGGAIGNAIVGTILISLFSVALATPVAIGTAIYLKKYAAKNLFTKTLTFFIDILSGTPSIVLGIFGLLVLVVYLRAFTGGYSLLSGGIALAILILPVMERAIEEAIDTVPVDLEYASFAIGATKWDSIRTIVIPYALPGILTGMILGIGRAAEESAVVVLTAGYSQFYPEFAVKDSSRLIMGIKIYPLQDLVGTLPISIYHSYEFMSMVERSDVFATAFVLIMVIMIINLSARAILSQFRMDKQRKPIFQRLFKITGRLPWRNDEKPAQPTAESFAGNKVSPSSSASIVVGILRENDTDPSGYR